MKTKHRKVTDRIYSNVEIPLCNILLTENDIYKNNKPSAEIIQMHFEREGRLTINAGIRILREVRRIFKREKNLIYLENPINICGDVHGQFFDLMTIFKIGGRLPDNPYLFLGDYVDRGAFSTEVIIFLFTLKINYPNAIWLLRGNHECRTLTESFTFKHECELKYSLKFYEECMVTFQYLPLVAIVSHDLICMHGGISPHISTLYDIENINRIAEPPIQGPLCDILWADPSPDYDKNTGQLFKANEARLCSYYYRRSLTRLSERVHSSVELPLFKVLLDEDEIYGNQANPSTELMQAHFEKEGRVSQHVALRILREVKKIFLLEKNLLFLNEPLLICGDTHGQFFDLLTIFKIGGTLPKNHYLFLGDYVDRGSFSTEVVLYLFSLKINYPNALWLLRGNHESRAMTQVGSFKTECQIKYSNIFYDACMDVFECLPLSAVVNQQFICMHGGISPHINTLADIQAIHRFREPPIQGPLCDLLWSDPFPEYDNYNGEMFKPNNLRACSYYYSYKAVCNFLKTNKLSCLIRAHEFHPHGIRFYKTMEPANFSSLVTVFSCPNYMDIYKNKASIIYYQGQQLSVKQFSAVEHPYWLPCLLDCITFSIPFVLECVTKIFFTILKSCTEGGDLSGSSDTKEKMLKMKERIRCVSRLVMVYSKARFTMERRCGIGLVPSGDTADSDSRLNLAPAEHSHNAGFFKNFF